MSKREVERGAVRQQNLKRMPASVRRETSEASPTLLPCPFCGKEADIFAYGVGCHNCSVYRMNREMWNRRAK
jgi:hypothetical protein